LGYVVVRDEKENIMVQTQASEQKRYAVLFVDDEEKSRKYFSKACGTAFRIYTAPGPARAREILRNKSDEIAVVVSDQRMPEQTGNELLSYARENHPDVVRMMTSAFADLGATLEAVNRAQIYRYITKPWDQEGLLNALASAMALFEQRRREREAAGESKGVMKAMLGAMAHELRTPLLSIRMNAAGLGRHLPELLRVYDDTKARGGRVPALPANRRQALAAAPESIERDVQRANATIDTVLAGLRDEQKAGQDTAAHSMRACVIDALSMYPFRENERLLIAVADEGDFEFRGSALLFTQVLHNLLENALRAVSLAGRGDICVQFVPGADMNEVHVRDTGLGISEGVRSKIFHDFFSSWNGAPTLGTGIGLAFCRRVVEGFGGELVCDTEEGRYTDMVVRLPHTGPRGI
jgi:signal transduction histidine kinase